jgi:hypothetical protein
MSEMNPDEFGYIEEEDSNRGNLKKKEKTADLSRLPKSKAAAPRSLREGNFDAFIKNIYKFSHLSKDLIPEQKKILAAGMRYLHNAQDIAGTYTGNVTNQSVIEKAVVFYTAVSKISERVELEICLGRLVHIFILPFVAGLTPKSPKDIESNRGKIKWENSPKNQRNSSLETPSSLPKNPDKEPSGLVYSIKKTFFKFISFVTRGSVNYLPREDAQHKRVKELSATTLYDFTVLPIKAAPNSLVKPSAQEKNNPKKITSQQQKIFSPIIPNPQFQNVAPLKRKIRTPTKKERSSDTPKINHSW